MQKYWFKAKQYGWGWYPSSWQGFLVLVVYFLILILEFLRVDSTSNSVSDTFYGVAFQFIILTIMLLLVCYTTGERPKWRWGKN